MVEVEIEVCMLELEIEGVGGDGGEALMPGITWTDLKMTTIATDKDAHPQLGTLRMSYEKPAMMMMICKHGKAQEHMAPPGWEAVWPSILGCNR
jgi:hypothetical protein